MSDRPWHRRFHDDALGGYMGLSLEERGAYTTLLDLMYQNREAIADNERMNSGWMQCSVRKYQTLRDSLIAKGKITRAEGGRLTNSRFENELAQDRLTSRTNSESGQKGGRKTAETRKKDNENSGGEQRSLDERLSADAAFSYAQSSEGSSERKENVIEDIPADAGSTPSKYAFEANTIRLTATHLEAWKTANPHVAVESALWALDGWAGELKATGKNWFTAVSSALAKRESDARHRIQMARVGQEAGPRRQLMPDPAL